MKAKNLMLVSAFVLALCIGSQSSQAQQYYYPYAPQGLQHVQPITKAQTLDTATPINNYIDSLNRDRQAAALLELTRAQAANIQADTSARQQKMSVTQTCMGKSDSFITQADCIQETIKSHPEAKSDLFAQRYLQKTKILEKKVKNKSLSEDEARLELLDYLSEIHREQAAAAQ